MRRSKAVSAASLIAVLALVLSACGGGGAAGSSADVKSMATGKAQTEDGFTLADAPKFDKVTVAIDEGYSAYNNDTPDSHTVYNNFIAAPMLGGAFVYDGNNKVLLNKDYMQSVTVTSKDPQVVEWKIKPGIKWSDGAPWNCKDFYLAWLSHSGKPKKADGSDAFIPAGTTGHELIDQATCKDDLTFETKFSSPYLDYKGLYNSPAMMPAHVLERETGIGDITKLTPDSDPAQLEKAGEFWNDAWKGFKPNLMPSSGQYKITGYDENSQQVTLARNENYPGAKGGPQQIVVRAMPDTKAMATSLENGEIDVAASTQPDATSAENMKGLDAQGVTYGSAPELSFEHFDLNFKRIFADESARKAFFQAVNRQEIVDKLLKPVQDDAQVLNSLQFFQGEPGYQDVYGDKAGQGPQAAAKTLQDAGWRRGPDGIFAKNGKRFSVTVTHNQNERRSQTTEIVQSQLKAAGIEINDETDPNFLKGRLDQGDYDVALFGWSAAPFKAESIAQYRSGGNQNFQGLADPRVDAAFDKASSATEEPEKVAGYQEADKYMAEDRASLPLFQNPSMWGFRGIDQVYHQSYNGSMWNAGEWQKTE